jgi:hypothetical protein
MQKLARTSKEWWKNNANKYLNKKIEWEDFQKCLTMKDNK